MNAMPAGPSPDPSGGGGGGFDDGGDLSAQHAGWIVKDTASRLLGLAYNRTHTGNPQRLCVHRRQRRAERVAAKRRKEASAAREGEMVSLDEFPELEELIKVSGIAAPAFARVAFVRGSAVCAASTSTGVGTRSAPFVFCARPSGIAISNHRSRRPPPARVAGGHGEGGAPRCRTSASGGDATGGKRGGGGIERRGGGRVPRLLLGQATKHERCPGEQDKDGGEQMASRR